ncbi:MAG: hypothetical protein IIB57_14560 [Planctomycetes bacterium]|nr:hypothetical protein [Planctomycetota bacterium]
MKERLDDLLADTTRIERAQMDTVDTRELKNYLDEVTRIKLTALDELTHEDLRSDRMFLIFLMQCGNVINKIQAKISINLLVPPKTETPKPTPRDSTAARATTACWLPPTPRIASAWPRSGSETKLMLRYQQLCMVQCN